MLILVERQGRWWFEDGSEHRGAASDLLVFVGRALAWVEECPPPSLRGSVHDGVLSILSLMDRVGRATGMDGAVAMFRAKCREHSDYLTGKFADRGFGLPATLVNGIEAEVIGAEDRKEVAAVTDETLAHLASHARELLNFSQSDGAPVDGPADLCFSPSVDDASRDRRYMYVGHQTAIVEMHRGYSLFLDLRDLSLVPTLLQTGWWQPSFEQVLRSVLAPGMSYVNAGANVGYHACLGAGLVGYEGTVFIFEPNPLVFSLLRRSVSYNGFSTRATLFNAAVSDENGQTEFFVCDEQSGSASVVDPRLIRTRTLRPDMVRGEDAFSYGQDAYAVLQVPCVTLDATVGRKVDSLDILHMDVEGSESAAILGARDLIARSRELRIIMDWSVGTRSDDAAPQQHRAAISVLADERFKFYRIVPPRGNLYSTPPDLTRVNIQDLLDQPRCNLFVTRS